MNDFTKEELLEIYGLLEHHYCDPHLCINPNLKLLIKLQAMINDYCEPDPEPCYHFWIAEQAELLLQGYDVTLTPELNKIKCSLCGIYRE
jgi:hypothetical protein